MSEESPSSGESAQQSNQPTSVVTHSKKAAQRLWVFQKKSIRKYWEDLLEEHIRLRKDVYLMILRGEPFLIFSAREPNLLSRASVRGENEYNDWMKELYDYIEYQMTRYDIYSYLEPGDQPYDEIGAWSLHSFFSWKLHVFDKDGIDRAVYWSEGSGLTQMNGVINR